MSRRPSIRARVLAVPFVPAVVLLAVVILDVRRSAVVIVAAAIAAAAGFAVAMVVARTIARPLRDLATIAAATSAGNAGADDTLLPPREIHDDRELGDLAVAIATGRRRAAALLDEARLDKRSVTDLVAHLALRNDRLLGAALDALADIGRRDHEPTTGAAIARVHRLVARVDRATASALVLIGEGGRLAPTPAPVSDIAWSAAMAVESADRVELAVPPAYVHADAVHDVGHLVAELIDNAVAASPPPARVTVIGQPDRDGGYVLSVVDAGSGLTGDELDRANRRVRRLVPLAQVPTRHVGLDVVGRLARRHGVGVRLGASAGGGVVVRVELPPALLVAPAATPAPVPVDAMEMPELGVPVADGAGHAANSPAAGVEPWTPAVAAADADAAEAAFAPAGAVVATLPVTDPPAPALDPVGAGLEPVLDLAAAERAEARAARTRHDDELLPRRDQRKWAAALARARN